MDPLPIAEQLPRRPIRVREWHAMIAAGVYGPEDKVELIEGVIVPMSPQGQPHVRLLARLNRLLVLGAPNGWVVLPQCSITLGEYSEPEPDLAVVPATEAEHETEHASHPALCVEVAHTSLAIDRLKTATYAAHGVPEVWIVDVKGRRIEVYRDPDPSEARYRSLDTVTEGSLAPAGLRGIVIDVGQLFA